MMTHAKTHGAAADEEEPKLNLVVYFKSRERDPLDCLVARRRHARFHVAKTRVPAACG